MSDEGSGFWENPEEPAAEQTEEVAEPMAPAEAEPVAAPLDVTPVVDTTPVPPVAMTEAPAAGGKRTGLIVAVVVAVLVIAGIGAFFALRGGSTTGTTGTTGTTAGTTVPSRDKITVAISFVKALLDGNTNSIRTFLTDDAQKAITDAQWKELAAQDSTSAITYAAPVWTGDTTAVVTFTAADQGAGESTGTLIFRFDETEPLAVVMSAIVGETTEVDTIALKAVGTGWRVLSISNGTQTTTFDAELIKSMVATPTASSVTTP